MTTSQRCSYSCCGLFELEGMAAYERSDIRSDILREVANEDSPQNGTVAKMCTVTDEQLTSQFLADALHEDGWRVVARWINTNSGNWCNLLVQGYRVEFPQQAVEAEVAPPVAPAPVARRYSLIRLRFDEDGVVDYDRSVEVLPPREGSYTDEEMSQAIGNYKSRFTRTDTSRFRFTVVES